MTVSLAPSAPAPSDPTPSIGDPSLVPGLVLVAVGTMAAIATNQISGAVSTLLAAVVVGSIIGNSNAASTDTAPGISFAAKRILRLGVVLLGLRLSVDQVTALGLRPLLIVATTVAFTFIGVQWLGRRMGLSPALSLLVGTGFSICGLSAIAAVEGSADAEDEEVAAAMGLVTLFGTLAIFVVPALGGLVGLTDTQLGTWAGASVHDTAQVVAAAGAGGATVLSVAIAVKLTRVLLLAPIVAGLNLRRSAAGLADGGNRAPLVPAFVIGFIAMIAIRTLDILPDSTLSTARTLEGLALAAAMVGLGANVRIAKLRSLGSRPLLLGIVAWAVVASFSLAGVLLFV